MQSTVKKRSFFTFLVVLANVILVGFVIYSVLTAFNNFEKVSFSQNIENVRTLTNASANKVELELDHHRGEILRVSDYVNQYNDMGMTVDEMKSYFTSLYAQQDLFCWELVGPVIENGNTSKEGFPAISLCEADMDSFHYDPKSYPELARIFGVAKEDNLGSIHYTREFTDAAPTHEKSFALTTTVRVREGEGYEYQTLMCLIRSAYINEIISNNNEVDIWNFFDYSNIIVDNQGDYVISNGYFQGTNFMDYITLYNPSFTKEDAENLRGKLTQENYSDVLYYQNNREQSCAYTIVPVQDSDWHVLSIVPLSSFHNTYDFSNIFLRFAVGIAALFLIDILVVLLVNHKLRIMTKNARVANESKSQFLSSMSHDIRTPLNAIIGMTTIVKRQINEEELDREAISDSVETISQSGNHLLTLINDILDISKIESGKVILRPVDFSMIDSLQKMVEMCQPEVEEKQFVFEQNIHDIIHETVTADLLRVTQIYMNILSNALKYTEPGGRIIVELTEESLAEQSQKARYIYKVSDTGVGMSPEFMETMFDRFTRAVDTRINTVRGTGLGMAIVKQLVDLLDGTIQVESKINVGSVFTVTLDLPIAQKALETKAHQETQVNETEDFSEVRVLVAEDNDTNWKVLNKILQYYHVNAHRAENGQIAVDMVKNTKESYDLILMDIQMPVMNGYEATRRIRELVDQQRASAAIYAMTADTFTEDIKKCEEAGMDGHLPKPVEIEKVIALLRQIIRKKESQ